VIGSPAWFKEQSSTLLKPHDQKRLQDDNILLKQRLNILEEEKKSLKAQADKYKRRAEYTVEKF